MNKYNDITDPVNKGITNFKCHLIILLTPRKIPNVSTFSFNKVFSTDIERALNPRKPVDLNHISKNSTKK